ncbi:MAG: 30S ribosomal protein S5 [Chlamydiae bacterium]|nr:30S ribosomal protein S5 [Chlamydiota bacterium]
MAKEEEKFAEKILYINRCSKVVKGGRKFSFSALVLVGDHAGRVGFGFAKANEVAEAIHKATALAKKSIIEVKIEGTTIPHSIKVKQDGVQLLLKPAKTGTGITAGSMVRSVLEFAGIKDVVAKTWGKNPNNQVLAVFSALKQLRTKDQVLMQRG